MALLFRGKTQCSLCNNIIQPEDDVVAFSAFVSNVRDPLMIFYDAAFHAACFHRHPLAQRALQRVHEQQQRYDKICVVCQQSIVHYSEYVTFGHLTDDTRHPLYPYNYLQFHRVHLPAFPDLRHIHTLLGELQSSGVWEGPGLLAIMEDIKDSLRGETSWTNS